MYRNIIFDLYGTLVDIRTDEFSLDFWRRAVQVFAMGGASFSPGELRTAYTKYVKRALRRERLKHPTYKHVDIDLLEVFRKLFSDKGINADMTRLRETARRFRKDSTQFIRLYDGVTELLDGLREAGKKIYLLSNAQESFTMPEMDELGILPYFDGVMISSEERVCKPQRQFFEKLLNKYQLDPQECLMVGNDKNSDMMGAKSVGVDGLYIHQEISPEVSDESEICALYKIMDGDVRKILPWILEA
ncbi:MAG: HAD family hydrolase [Ruminococcus sp.]|nr:HAD family hydrolase [Ruminococcus sp.]